MAHQVNVSVSIKEKKQHEKPSSFRTEIDAALAAPTLSERDEQLRNLGKKSLHISTQPNDLGIRKSALFASLRYAVQSIERQGNTFQPPTNDSSAVDTQQTAAKDVLVSKDTFSLLLNNLACLERKCGNLDACLANLQSVSSIEGGVDHAPPSTLINLAAAYSALRRFEEASAIARVAVQRTEISSATENRHSQDDEQKCRKDVLLKVAALHNFGVALDGSGKLSLAIEIYKEAHRTLHSLKTTDETFQQYKDMIQKCLDRCIAVQGVSPSMGPKNVNLPPLKNSTRSGRGSPATPPTNSGALALITATEVGDQTEVEKKEDVAGGSRSLVVPHHTPALEGTAKLYSISVRKFHARRTLSPISKRSGSHLLMRRKEDSSMSEGDLSLQTTNIPYSVLSDSHEPSSTAMVHLHPSPHVVDRARSPDIPEWNSDPMVSKSSVSHRIVFRHQRDLLIEREVDERYVPRALVPLVEDLRYKETTRRQRILQEWKTRLGLIELVHRVAYCQVLEDENRLHVEIEEERVQTVLVRWIRGKIQFHEAVLELDAQESAARDLLFSIAVVESRGLDSVAALLLPQAMEEAQRFNFEHHEKTEFATLSVESQRRLAIIEGKRVARETGKSLAYALTLWCFENTLNSEEVAAVSNPALTSSLFVIERYATFGRQTAPANSTWGSSAKIGGGTTQAPNMSPAEAPLTVSEKNGPSAMDHL